MAHEIEGNNIFTVGARPWHGLGTVLDNPPTIEEGIRCAGLDWNVRLEQLVTATTNQSVPAYATVRETDNTILGTVGSSYKPVQNIEAFQWFNPYLESGVVTLESAGSLFGGRKVWVLGKIAGANLQVVKNDEVERYILLQNSFDGSTAVRIGYTPIRVVCNNTLNAALDNNGSKLVRIFHVGDVSDTMAKVREVMNVADQTFEATLEQYKQLAKGKINTSDLKALVKKVFRRNVETQAEAEETANNGEEKESKIITRVSELFESGRGNDMKGVRGTKWAAYNAVVEYLQYERGDNDDNRFNNLWFKQGNSNKGERALKMLLAS